MIPEYDRVKDEIAERLFGLDRAGTPVYALADDKTLEEIASSSGLSGTHPLEAIAAVVRRSLALDDSGVAPFHHQAVMAKTHRSEALSTPESLPLLIVLAAAAERMQADGHIAANNYYSRLHGLLDTPIDRRARVEEDYRRSAIDLWGSLNAWLEAWEGERGIPTAYAIGGHAYIGLPISQAVVRQHDRAGLHELFALEGLSPGLRMSPSDMSAAMESYASSVPTPLSSHITRLWKIPSARERIVDAACVELQAWDGREAPATSSANRPGNCRLLAFLRTFPRRSVEFGLMLPFVAQGTEFATFQNSSGKVMVPTIAGPAGSTRLSGTDGVSQESLIGEGLRGWVGADGSDRFERRPRRVVPLRWDDIQGAFVEVERIALGEEALVVVKAEARQAAESYLAVHARPGWDALTDFRGLPEGWCVFRGVQIMSAPSEPTHLDLLPLTPRMRTSLSLQGGFVLPGRLRKWSSLDPPEVVAMASGASSVAIRVYDGTQPDPSLLLIEESSDGELGFVALADEELSDGEYLVAMFVDESESPASTSLLRLRSANTPQFSVDDVDIRLVYSPDSGPKWPVSAGPAKWPRFVNGARPVHLIPTIDDTPVAMKEYVPRERGEESPPPPLVRVGTELSSDSCLVTGMHRFRLPTVLPGQIPTRSIEGECDSCGLVKRFAGTPWAARRRATGEAPRHLDLAIPPIAQSSAPDFEVAFDALNHVGHGNFNAFESIAAQVEGSGLFADSFLRRQEVVGHLDVTRDEWLRVTEWAVNSATLVPIDDDRWVLIGSRSTNLIDALRSRLVGQAALLESVDAGLARVEVLGSIASPGSLDEIGVKVLDESPAFAVAASLPPLSVVEATLDRIVVPKYRSAEVWDTRAACWRRTDSVGKAGAYRLKEFRSIYIVRSDEDIARGTMAIANAQLAKHVANRWANDPLAGYNTRSGSVVVPLGADLPGMYGRALSLCSGRAPRELVESRMLQYQGVPRNVADVINTRLAQ